MTLSKSYIVFQMSDFKLPKHKYNLWLFRFILLVTFSLEILVTQQGQGYPYEQDKNKFRLVTQNLRTWNWNCE